MRPRCALRCYDRKVDRYPEGLDIDILGLPAGDWVRWHVGLVRPPGGGLADPHCGYWHGTTAANDDDAGQRE